MGQTTGLDGCGKYLLNRHSTPGLSSAYRIATTKLSRCHQERKGESRYKLPRPGRPEVGLWPMYLPFPEVKFFVDCPN